ncbi:LOW QUALITY PROTEIN: hypothetical protein Cgig2_027670 [Carnegiea gigantea]|uniref:Uncharacterized protein n=1 Tax=Carnegiea gigantea TaxID=171969 RepID=A0A9Q1Q5M1_9CARY|nr:LOW QUALITY PROTEIN: hypothetical protein Cgig2_027670 [Carnegiea gigantea]
MRPLLRFEYVPTRACEPSHRHSLMVSHRDSEGIRKAPHTDRNGRSRGENRDQSVGVGALHSHCPIHRRSARSTTVWTLHATHSRETIWFEEQTSRPRGEASITTNPKASLRPRTYAQSPSRQAGYPILKSLPPMTLVPKPHNVWKYYEFHEQNGHATAECQEFMRWWIRINRCLKRGPRFLRAEREPKQPEPQDEECFMPSFEERSRFSRLSKAAELQGP